MAANSNDTTVSTRRIYRVILHTEKYGDIRTDTHWNKTGATKDVKAFARIGKQASIEVVEVAQ